MFNMSDAEVSKYKITNVNTGSRYDCMANSSNYCEKEIDTSGTYYVTAYDKSGRVLVNNQNMSVKIYRSGIDFSITGVTSDYDLSSTICNGNKKATVSFNIERNNSSTEFYKKIEYKVIRIKNDGTKEEAYSKVITALKDSFDIGSGHYQIEVTVTNEADVPLTKKSSEFDVSYKAILKYGDVNGKEFKVVKDYPYNLPTHVNAYGESNLEVKWYNGTTRIYPTTIVEEDCIHTITGEVAIVVDVPSDLNSYCVANIIYNGSKQTIATGAPTNITFTNNEQTNAGDYKVKAHIDSPRYIWSDGTFDDKEYTCSIGRKAVDGPSCTARTYNGKSQTMLAEKKSGEYTNDAITGTIATSYTKTLVLNSNYKWSSGSNVTSNRSKTCTISKATNTVTITKKTCEYTGKACSVSAAATNGTPSITYYSNSNCTTKTTTSNAVSAGGAPKKSGTYWAKAIVDESTNYLKGDSGCKEAVTINPDNWCYHNTYVGGNNNVCNGGSTVDCCLEGCRKLYAANSEVTGWRCTAGTGDCWLNWVDNAKHKECETPPSGSSSSGGSSSCTADLACGKYGSPYYWYGSVCYYTKMSFGVETCKANGCTPINGGCYCSVQNAACT